MLKVRSTEQGRAEMSRKPGRAISSSHKTRKPGRSVGGSYTTGTFRKNMHQKEPLRPLSFEPLHNISTLLQIDSPFERELPQIPRTRESIEAEGELPPHLQRPNRESIEVGEELPQLPRQTRESIEVGEELPQLHRQTRESIETEETLLPLHRQTNNSTEAEAELPPLNRQTRESIEVEEEIQPLYRQTMESNDAEEESPPLYYGEIIAIGDDLPPLHRQTKESIEVEEELPRLHRETRENIKAYKKLPPLHKVNLSIETEEKSPRLHTQSLSRSIETERKLPCFHTQSLSMENKEKLPRFHRQSLSIEAENKLHRLHRQSLNIETEGICPPLNGNVNQNARFSSSRASEIDIAPETETDKLSTEMEKLELNDSADSGDSDDSESTPPKTEMLLNNNAHSTMTSHVPGTVDRTSNSISLGVEKPDDSSVGSDSTRTKAKKLVSVQFSERPIKTAPVIRHPTNEGIEPLQITTKTKQSRFVDYDQMIKLGKMFEGTLSSEWSTSWDEKSSESALNKDNLPCPKYFFNHRPSVQIDAPRNTIRDPASHKEFSDGRRGTGRRGTAHILKTVQDQMTSLPPQIDPRECLDTRRSPPQHGVPDDGSSRKLTFDETWPNLQEIRDLVDPRTRYPKTSIAHEEDLLKQDYRARQFVVNTIYRKRNGDMTLTAQSFSIDDSVPDCSLRVHWRMGDKLPAPTLNIVFHRLSCHAYVKFLTRLSMNSACAVFSDMQGAQRVCTQFNPCHAPGRLLICEWMKLQSLCPRSAASISCSEQAQAWLKRVLEKAIPDKNLVFRNREMSVVDQLIKRTKKHMFQNCRRMLSKMKEAYDDDVNPNVWDEVQKKSKHGRRSRTKSRPATRHTVHSQKKKFDCTMAQITAALANFRLTTVQPINQ